MKVFSKRPVKCDPKQQKKALEFVGKQQTTGAKDIWKLLEMVVSDPDIDTAYLLSSGEPDVGLYVHWNRALLLIKTKSAIIHPKKKARLILKKGFRYFSTN